MEEQYCPDFGRPAIHPEVMVRALLVCPLYNIASFRILCSAISKNIAFRWFCFLTIDDPVFDHSSITHFIDRIGREGFAEIYDGLKQELLHLGLFSREMYVDSTLVKANVSGYGLAPSGMTVAELKEQAIEENGLFMITGTAVDGDSVEHETARYFQSPEGRMPLNPVDTDARWRTPRASRASGLQYQENVIADRGGFILSRGVTHVSERESKAVSGLIEKLPLHPVSLAGDSGNCWRNGTSRPASPSTPGTGPAWFPPGNSSTTATTWFALRAKSCAGAVSTSGAAPTGTWRVRKTVRPAPQGNLPSTKAETSVLHPDDVLSRVPAGQGTKLF